MSIPAGAHKLGPGNGTLWVKTGRTGAAAKAGHDLLMHVTEWAGTLEGGDEASVVLRADATSLRVREGSGGMQKLGDDDIENIHQTIDDDVLKRTDIGFRSLEVDDAGDRLGVRGELTLLGEARPLAFDLTLDGARLTGSVLIKQSEWGMKPYSALFGALKVADEVEVGIDAELPAAQ